MIHKKYVNLTYHHCTIACSCGEVAFIADAFIKTAIIMADVVSTFIAYY